MILFNNVIFNFGIISRVVIMVIDKKIYSYMFMLVETSILVSMPNKDYLWPLLEE